ncbi:hypothetical protein [Aquirufa sp.]|jgi:hypothetical protein|uniref:hypothetical protein n=1 Tax=Aquirufa sp. TaxID=2676249 RepID=UPI0037C05CAA
MIVLIEPQCRGFEHEQFNAALLFGYSLAYPQSEIIFFAERGHIDCVKAISHSSQLSITNVHFKEIIIPETKALARPSVIFQYFKLLQTLLDFAKSNDCSKIAFLSIYTYNLIPLKYLLRYKYKNSFKVHIAMHGTLEFIKRENFVICRQNFNRLIHYIIRKLNIKTKVLKIKPANRFLYEKFFKLSLTFIGNQEITYFVLRKDSLAKINNYLPKELKYFNAIDHPYIYREFNFNREETPSNKLTFATFGKFNKTELRQIANYFSLKNSNNTEIKLIIIGGDENDILDTYENVEYPIKFRRFTREEFEQILRRVDYFIFLYEEDLYELTTSGAFFDAIANSIPMVFLKNYCFDHYYENYNFGYQCNDINGMLMTLDKVIENHKQNYKGLVSEIRRMQNDTSISHNYSKLNFNNVGS